MASRVSRREGWRSLAAAPESGWPEAFQGTCRAGGGIAKGEVAGLRIAAGRLPRSTRGCRWGGPRARRLTGRSGRWALLHGCFRGEGPLLPAALSCGCSELRSRGGHGQVPGADRPGGRPGGGPRLRPRATAGVRSQPSGRRDARADGRPVLGGLQPLRDQPAGGSADPQRLHAQSGGDPEELRAFI